MVTSPVTTVQSTVANHAEMMETSLSSGQCKPEFYESLQSMDHTLPSENLVQELSYMYTASPDSLYMYDQDRSADTSLTCSGAQDLHLFPGGLRPPETTDTKFNDLYNLSTGFGLDDNSQVNEFCNMNWGNKDIEYVNMDEVFQDSNDANQGPTLTQLNSFLSDGQYPRVPFQQGQGQGQTGISQGKHWPMLEEWTQPEVPQRGSSLEAANQPGPSNMSDTRSWTDLSHNTMPSMSDEQFSSRTSTPSNDGDPMSAVKQEPKLSSDCENIQQFYKTYAQQYPSGYNSSSLYRLLLQGQLAAKHSNPSSPSPPHSPAKRAVTAAMSKAPCASNSSNSMEEKWEEIKQFLHDTGQDSKMCPVNVKRERLDSGSSVITSLDELEGREYESPDSGEDESEQESSDSDESLVSFPGTSKPKEKQYFWQYNLQSKGPKGRKLCMSLDTKDPHVLPNFEDPVFDPDYRVPGITHGGKARRGDGNNVYPNPKKLCQIGNELKKLNRRISEYGPLNEMSSSARNKSRKEKNKLASRACRLKKKAQHEANKVKLLGLEQEHSQLMQIISRIKDDTLTRLSSATEGPSDTLTQRLETYVQAQLKNKIAGNTTEFVNSVIRLVNAGDPKGGLDL